MLQDQRPDSHAQSDGDLDIKQHMPTAFFVKGLEHPVDQRSKDDRADDNGQGHDQPMVGIGNDHR